MLKAGHQVAHLDPVPILSAMAAVTETVSFAATCSTSYVNPYILARQFSTLDHLTDGRVGWNIVTSHTKGAAKAMGLADVVPHDERYLVADEYMEVVYKLWESSWADDSVVWSDEVAYDPSKIKKIEHKGKVFTSTTWLVRHNLTSMVREILQHVRPFTNPSLTSTDPAPLPSWGE